MHGFRFSVPIGMPVPARSARKAVRMFEGSRRSGVQARQGRLALFSSGVVNTTGHDQYEEIITGK